MKGIKFIQMFETKGGSELVFLGQLDILEDLEFDDVVKRIVQPNRHKGKWIDSGQVRRIGGYSADCSACGEWSEYLSNFCGNCGADMRGEEC